MQKVEAKQLMTKYLSEYLLSLNFVEKKISDSDFQYINKRKNGKWILNGGINNYNPSQGIIYNFSIINYDINSVLIKLNEKIEIKGSKISKETATIGFSYNTLFDNSNSVYLPFMETETDVKKCADMMVAFINEYALPIFAEFEDLAGVDKIVNGDKPWEDDWHKPYVFGGNFNFKRLIISNLFGNGNYDRIFHFVKEYLMSKFNDKYGEDFKVEYEQVLVLDSILKN